MSISTRIHGFTAWINLRLSSSSGQLLDNVLVDLLKGYNMKILLESLTGKPFKKIRSFDGLSLVQKETRVGWMVEELKNHEVVPDKFNIDSRMFAMRSADQVFELLWCLVCHDIWFVWERSDFLLQSDIRMLLTKQFTWQPPSPPTKSRSYEIDKSLLSGFGSKSIVMKPSQDDEDKMADEQKWSLKKATEERDGDMINRTKMKGNKYPEPDYCVLDLINSHLKLTREGSKLQRGVTSLDDLTDSRVLAALVNSFIPETFTSEVLLNDRWTVNLILWTIAKMFKCPNRFECEDLVEGDIMAVCAYFIFFFMCGYRLKQSQLVVEKMEQLKSLEININEELQRLQGDLTNVKQIRRKTDLDKEMESILLERATLEEIFNISECYAWSKHVNDVQIEIRTAVAQKIKEQYEIIVLSRNMTINDIMNEMMVNLSLTAGTGFYHLTGKDSVTKDRRIIVKDIEKGEFFDELKTDDKGKVTAREVLGIKNLDVVELNQCLYPQFEIYLDCGSKNKALKAGSKFLYQVFPGNSFQCQRLLYKAAKDGELESVKKLVAFFEKSHKFVNSRDKKSGNTAMHIACRNGNFEIVEFLLESGAEVDCLNIFGVTPFFLALEGLHRNIGQLLMEWGADIQKKNRSGKTALDLLRHAELKEYFRRTSNDMAISLPRIIAGDSNMLLHIIKEHRLGTKKIASLRSRSLSGSTLLHTAAYYGNTDAVKMLLAERVDVNLLDYKGATPLHRVKDAATMQLLLDAGADITMLDEDRNSPLHVKCYGEQDEATSIDCIQLLLEKRISLIQRNCRDLLPIHCCAMQGRIDGMKVLLAADSDGVIRRELSKEQDVPPSLPHLAIANDHLETASWLLEKKFYFKEREADILLEKLLLDRIPCSDFNSTINILVSSGASARRTYSHGNTPIHLAATQQHMTGVLELLLAQGSDVNATNDDRCTPLFFATRSNNYYGAKVLLQNGADLRLQNYQGLTAFDFIRDYDEWIDSGCFKDDHLSRLKAYSLKQTRDLVRTISKKVQGSRQTFRGKYVPTLLPAVQK